MKIQMEDEIYEGTPEEIAEAMLQNMFYPNEFANVDEYLIYMSESYERLTDIPCPLPEGSTDERARALIEKLAEIDVLEILEG